MAARTFMQRYALELILRKELLEHDYPPEGLRFVEAGDVVGEASYEGELNAVFRVSGFSLHANGAKNTTATGRETEA